MRLPHGMFVKPVMKQRKKTLEVDLMCGSCHFDRLLNVEIGVEYQMIFVVVFFNCSCEIHFGAPSRLRKGWVISSKTCTAFLFVFLTWQKKK